RSLPGREVRLGILLLEHAEAGRDLDAHERRRRSRLPASAGREREEGRDRTRAQPHCTERFVSELQWYPVIGKRASFGSSSEAPIATITGTKCSCVGSADRTPGARSR